MLFRSVLGTTADKLNTIEPVTKYGLDSLMANQIRNWIQSNLAIDYSMMKIMRGPSMEEMTTQILDELDDLKLAVLEGRISADQLNRIVSQMSARREQSDDHRLEDVLDGIDLRAQVELAKLGRFAG